MGTGRRSFYNVIARTIENFWIGSLFRQSNNEFYMGHLHLLIWYNIKIKMKHRKDWKDKP